MTEIVCSNCGTPTRAAYRAPQPEIAPDLDMRPGEPARSTLQDWIQLCRGCGAAAPDVSKLPPGSKETIESPGYRTLSTEVLEETLPFRRWALICQHAGNPGEQAEALLQAAWAADDAAAMTEAAGLRGQVAALWDGTSDVERGLRRLDVLRRAGRFDEAAGWAAIMIQNQPDELARSIITFQQARIGARDIGRHLISSALPPPAVKPHITHGKRTTTSFWSRLLRKQS